MVSRALAKKLRRTIRIDLWGLYGFLTLTAVSKVIFPKQDYENRLQRSSKLGYPVFNVESGKLFISRSTYLGPTYRLVPVLVIPTFMKKTVSHCQMTFFFK